MRQAVAELDSELPVLTLQAMPQLIRNRTRFYRFQSPPFIVMGIVALLLAVGGLYAVVSYMSSLRTVEFGVRAALGARRAELVRRSVGSVWVPTLVGGDVGLFAGLTLTAGFDRWVFLVDPSSPWVAGASITVFLLTAGVARLGPALRASRVDVVQVLKAD